jgi:GNAT superfamily N-acetyltransferase
MELIIRNAEPGDARAIARVHVESWRSTYTDLLPQSFLASLDVDLRARMWTAQIADGKSATLVAERDGDVVGFISGGPSRETIDDYDAELYAVYLLHEHQGCGIGRAMVSALVRSLREQGFSAMLVLVLEKNPAVTFYAGLGGTPIGKKPIEIGGVTLNELIYAWPNFDSFY